MNNLQDLLLKEMKKQFGEDFQIPDFKSEEEARTFIQSKVDDFTWYAPKGFENYTEEEICFELGIRDLMDIFDFPYEPDTSTTYDDNDIDDFDNFDYFVSSYVDTYSPGDDFETDWFNSLE